MKTFFVAVVAAACLAVALAGNCDSTGIETCAKSVATCYAKNPTNHCVCFADELSCMEGLGCGPNVLSGVVKGCEATGCSVTACGGPIVNNCNSTAMSKCAQDVSTCIQGGTTLCTCEGDLVQCYSNLGCGSQVMSSVEKACTSAGCSASQCGGSRRLVADLVAAAMPNVQ